MADAVRGSIVINEVLPDPNSAAGSSGPRHDTDHSGTVTPVDEFIEIYNSGPNPVDIGGLQLWDQTLGNWFTFPSGTILAPGAHAMVMTGAAGGPGPALGPGDMAFYAGRGSAVLNNGPENAILYDPVAHTYAQIAYGGASIVTPGTPGNFATFPAGTTRIGSGENFGPFTPGYSLQRSPDGGNTIVSGSPNPADDNLCFAADTLIETPHGPRPVQTLRAGDPVLTANDRVLPLLWVGETRHDNARLWAEPRLWPVTIRAHAFGPGLPARELSVSRQHRLRFRSDMADGSFVLIPAASFLGCPGVQISRPAGELRYFHLLLADHSILLANGLPAESLYLGPQTLAILPETALDQITVALGRDPRLGTPPVPVHPLLGISRAQRQLRKGQALHP